MPARRGRRRALRGAIACAPGLLARAAPDRASRVGGRSAPRRIARRATADGHYGVRLDRAVVPGDETGDLPIRGGRHPQGRSRSGGETVRSRPSSSSRRSRRWSGNSRAPRQTRSSRSQSGASRAGAHRAGAQEECRGPLRRRSGRHTPGRQDRGAVGSGSAVNSARIAIQVNVDVQRFCQSNGAATLSVPRWPPEGAVASFRRPGTPLART